MRILLVASHLGIPCLMESEKEGDTYLSVKEVVSPQRSDLVLSTHVPYCETDVLVLYCLNVESCVSVCVYVCVHACDVCV